MFNIQRYLNWDHICHRVCCWGRHSIHIISLLLLNTSSSVCHFFYRSLLLTKYKQYSMYTFLSSDCKLQLWGILKHTLKHMTCICPAHVQHGLELKDQTDKDKKKYFLVVTNIKKHKACSYSLLTYKKKQLNKDFISIPTFTETLIVIGCFSELFIAIQAKIYRIRRKVSSILYLNPFQLKKLLIRSSNAFSQLM